MSYCINPNCPKPQNPENLLFCQTCGSQLLLEGRYRVMRLLGEGGFAKTYEVSDCGTPKVLKLLFLNQPKAVSLFQQESQVLSRLNHPGIPKVAADGYFTFSPRNSQQPAHCLVMEKIEGINLEELMSRRNNQPIPEALALDWLKQLAEILAQVNQQNYFHRDIKPANIMLRISPPYQGEAEGKLVLIDFGTAREITATILGGGPKVTQIVSAGYTPLEQACGQAVPQSDFFALGRTFVYLLTGKSPRDLPADSATGQLLWRNSAPQISDPVANLIDDLMALLPASRPQTSQIILQRLAEIERSLSQPSPPAGGSLPPAAPVYAGFWRRFTASLTDTGIVTVAAAAIGAFLLNSDSNITDGSLPALDVFLKAAKLTALGTIGGLIGLLIAMLAILFRWKFFGEEPSVILWLVLLGMGVKWLYFTLLESSPKQATLGKMSVGIVVTDANGQRISWQRANRRYWSKTISGGILLLGFVLAGLTPKKRALHDMMAGTLVAKK